MTLSYMANAGWPILVAAYEYERNERRGTVHALNKINDAHIYTDKCPKMRTKYAMQIFSETMALYLELCRGKKSIEYNK